MSISCCTLVHVIPELWSIPAELSCSEQFEKGVRNEAIGTELFDGGVTAQVLCHFDIDGGWIVVQKRTTSQGNFRDQDETAYDQGFGPLDGNHWIGNLVLHDLSVNYVAGMKLRFNLTTTSNRLLVGGYDVFNVGPSNGQFAIGTLGSFTSLSGGMTDEFRAGTTSATGIIFESDTQCADRYGGFWYFGQICSGGAESRVILNGLYEDLKWGNDELKKTYMLVQPIV